MKLNKTSLKWKLLLIILTFSALVIFVFYVFQILLLDNIYRSTKITQTKTTMGEVYTLVNNTNIDELLDPDSILSQELNKQMELSESNIYICKQEAIMEDKLVVDLNYSFVFPYSSNNDYIERIVGKSVLNEVYNNMPPFGARFVILRTGDRAEFNRVITEDENALTGENIIYCQRVTISNDSNSYLLIIYSRMTPVQPAIDTLERQFWYISLVVIFLTVFVVFMLSRSISKPIIDITTAANNLAKGDYDSEFTGDGFKEIKELSDTLNYASKELKKTENLQRELLANVSHDIKTPLTSIINYVDLIKKEEIQDEKVQGSVEVLDRQSARLKKLIEDLMEAS